MSKTTHITRPSALRFALVALVFAIVASANLALTPRAASAYIGGEPVSSAEHQAKWDFAVELEITHTDNTTSTCTGALISYRVVATAAHCLVNVRSIDVHFADGTIGSGTSINVHGSYWHKTDENGRFTDGGVDLGVVNLRADAPVHPVEMGVDRPTEGDYVEGAGFGRTNAADGTSSGTLNEAWMQVVTCPDQAFGDRWFCSVTPSVDGGGMSCRGDSGGPIVSHTDRGPVLIGIVSRTMGNVACADAQDTLVPGHNRTWLTSRIGAPTYASATVQGIESRVSDEGDAIDVGVHVDVTRSKGHEIMIGVGFAHEGRYSRTTDSQFDLFPGSLVTTKRFTIDHDRANNSDPILFEIPTGAFQDNGDHQLLVWIWDMTDGTYRAVEYSSTFTVG